MRIRIVAPAMDYFSNPDVSFKAGLADFPGCHLCGLEGNGRVRLLPLSASAPVRDDVGEFTACIDPEHLVSIDFSLCLSVRGENGGVGDANGGNPMR